ncbi:hypothetical protein [Pseudofulvibacter geojedonensis]|uniref:Uncharacterized protein n=1 Tax=Pseudofulvibacter geojedonensis TaxID=1123758 RepID=A0ABW3HYZ5_9FLAO
MKILSLILLLFVVSHVTLSQSKEEAIVSLLQTVVNKVNRKDKVYVIDEYSFELNKYLVNVNNDKKVYKKSYDSIVKYFGENSLNGIKVNNKAKKINFELESVEYLTKNEVFGIFEKHGVAGWNTYYKKFGRYSFVYFSEPIFNKNKSIALIQVLIATGNRAAISRYDIYKFNGKEWIRVSKLTAGWVS